MKRTRILSREVRCNPAPPAGVATLGYNADSQVTTETLPDGNQTWAYTNGRVTGLTQTLTGAAVTSAALGYDPTGRVRTRTVNGATTTFGYDLASQLRTIAPGSGAATTYSYDNLGRRTNRAVGTTTTAYTYNAASQVTAATGKAINIDCDEYPFASSWEDGKGNYDSGGVSLRPIGSSDNRSAGARLGYFLRTCDVGTRFRTLDFVDESLFLVVPIPAAPKTMMYCKRDKANQPALAVGENYN